MIQRALWAGDNDQSLWFYHQFLMSNFDPKHEAVSMVPNLNIEERVKYLNEEILKVMDMLEGAEDCKWIYQSLIHMSILYKDLSIDFPVELEIMRSWLHTLRDLDPLRSSRWNDLGRTQGLMS